MHSIGRSQFLRNLSIVITAVSAVALLASPPAQAKITSIVIDGANSQNPTFGGTVFAESGATYQKISGRAFGEVIPTDPHNSVIVDINLADPAKVNPTTGGVKYSVSFVLLQPTVLANGNHRMFALIPNRGSPNGLSNIIGGNAATITPTSVLNAANAGNGFLMRKGFSILIMGWDVSAATAANTYNIDTPIAKNLNGTSIVGPSLEEFVIDTTGTSTSPALMYPAADFTNTLANKDLAKLSCRVRQQDPPAYLPSSAWEYVNATSIRLTGIGGPATFPLGLCEFTYPAKDPLIAGIGLAAMRDIMSFMRNASAGEGNPLAGDVQHIYTHCSSQPCRTMHDFVYLGFNQDEDGRQVTDGVLNWIATGNFLKLNYRFSNAGRTHRQHINRWYPEFEFPFSNLVYTDSVTGKTDGKFNRCGASDTCPFWMETFSENEYWAKAGSTTHFDAVKRDLEDPPKTRLYLMSSHPHGASATTAPGICQQNQNPLQPYSVLRAQLLNLDAWATSGTLPPATRLPRFDNGTLVRALPQSLQGFPNIPARPPVPSAAAPSLDTGLAVIYNGRMHTGDLFDYGPRYFTEGIVDNFPPILKGSPYSALVPKTDADGNDLAGIRLPEVVVPTATYTGWALRKNPAGANDGCDASGQKILFRKTVGGRLAIGDPRLSLDERYSSRADYIAKVTAAAIALRDARLMLQEDVDVYISGAGAAYDSAILATP